ncbi:MAG: tetratricopeptide repeat protein [Deltaproteobacteria bacterium]|nr:tetratricopeptide repeat protein [Deltaproteobacteria bacterium]
MTRQKTQHPSRVAPAPKNAAKWRVPPLALCALCVLLTAAVYSRVVDGAFCWDDRLLIVNNDRSLDEWADIGRAFTEPLGTTDAAYYRPVLMSTFVFDRQVSGKTASGFHRTNLILHCLNVALVWALLFVFTGRPITSTLGALFFALHPIQTHAVALIAGRHDLLLVPPLVALLLAYRAWWQSGEKSHAGLYAAVAVVFAWALWTKETALVLLPILPLADRLLLPAPKPSLRQRGVLYLLLLATTAVYFVVRWYIFGTPVGGSQYGNPAFAQRLAMAVATYGYYIQHILLPFGLSATPFYRQLVDTGSFEFLRALLLCGVCGYLWFAFFDSAALASFGFAVFVLFILPVAGVVPMKIYMLEPRIYGGMIGITLCVVASIGGLRDVRAAENVDERPQWVGVAVACFVLAVFAFADWQRIPELHDELALWKATVAAVPESSYARNSLGYSLMEAKRYPEAFDQYREGVRADPDDPSPRFNLAWLLEHTGKRSEAIVELRELLRRSPEHLGALNSLAVFLLRSDQLEEAEQVAKKGTQLAKDNPELLSNLALILERRGKVGEAFSTYQHLTQIEPGGPEHWRNLGRVLRKLDRASESVAADEKALAIGPDSGALQFALGLSYWKAGNGAQALDHAQRAQQMGYADHSLLDELRQAGVASQ